jgi:putative nucleotidyltransferase with HDIG domain
VRVGGRWILGVVTALAVPDAARAEAARLLGTASSRWKHTVAVAERACQVAPILLPPDEVDLLICAAWLHDIGYAQAVEATGFHPLDGARHLRHVGAADRLCRLVANHTAARVEASARGLAEELRTEFPPESSELADALTYADMTVGPEGQDFTVERRLAEILNRYPEGDVVHESIRTAGRRLVATVRRVELRLGAAVRHMPTA